MDNEECRLRRSNLEDDVNPEDILDDVLGGGDIIDDFHGLKGMISNALGKLGFKFSIVVVLLFNFIYTAYNAFTRKTKTEISVISLNNCSCDPGDRAFYSFNTFSCITLWIVFLVVCALYNFWKFIAELRHSSGTGCANNRKTNKNNNNTDARNTDINIDDVSRRKRIPWDQYWFLKRELRKLTTMALYLNIRSLYIEKIRSREEITSAVKYVLTHMNAKFLEIPLDNSFNFVVDDACKLFKCALIVIQFFLRLSIVPLLLVQWLDEYSWNCVVGSVKDYCKETKMGYTFDQSVNIFCLYVCVLLSIIIAVFIEIMPVTKLSSHHENTSQNTTHSQNKRTLQSRWCLLFEFNNTLFLTNINFIVIIALIYVSILSQFTYVAVIETERDINSGRTFNIGGKWFNRSISGGVTNSVLWKCSEESSAHYLKAFFLTLLTLLITITIVFAIMSLLITFVNHQRVKKLLKFYYSEMQNNIGNNSAYNNHYDAIATISKLLNTLFQLRHLGIPKHKTELILWKNAQASTKNSHRYRWCLFLIPSIELILILLLFLLVLTSYNVYPIGCFFTDVYYDEITNVVMLDLTEGVYIYQQVAVVTAIIIFFSLIFIKAFHVHQILTSDHPHQIYFFLPLSHNQIDYHII